jgi:uncharacterized protein
MLTIQVNTMNKIALLIQELIKYNHGDKKRISHALKVHSYAKTIAILEKVNEYDLFNLESAAILHDIGIKVCEEKYNSANGKLQEKEGPAVAREILESLDYKNINRILFLIGHHHTYTNVAGMDYQILIEADFLVNFEEENTDTEAIKKVYKNIFKTKTGKEFCRNIFDISP